MKNLKVLSYVCFGTAAVLLGQCGWENYQVHQLIEQGVQFNANQFFSASFIRLSVGLLFGLAGVACKS